MKNSLLIIFVTMSILSCSPKSNLKVLENDPLILKVFTTEETESLKNILVFFDTFISQHTNSDLSIDKAYKEYFATVDRDEDIDEIYIELGFQHSVKTKKLIQYLKESGIFKEIWEYDEQIKNNDGNKDEIVALDYSMQGKFVKLLKLYANGNSHVEKCVDFMVGSGGNSPAALSIFIKQFYKDADFTRELNRLLFAVEYITATSI